MDVGRLIVDTAARGAWNMAVDSALLESASATGQCSLRFYSWCEPTLSIGYFQEHLDRCGHAASAHLPLVRRASGGGAIVHDLELTYSYVARVPERQTGNVESLYYSFHETLVQTIGEWNVEATLCAPQSTSPPTVDVNEMRETGHPMRRRATSHERFTFPAASRIQRGTTSKRPPQPFLCFQRRSAGDLLIESEKIAGSAQRRYRRAVMQHGSILLQRSQHAPELPGIKELAEVEISGQDLVRRWLPRISDRLGVAFQVGALNEDERRLAEELEGARFNCASWQTRR